MIKYLPIVALCFATSAFSSTAGVIQFESLLSDATITSAAIVYFGGHKSGHFCNNPYYATHTMFGRLHFYFTNQQFDYHLYPTPIYNSFQPSDQISISQVHCIEFIIQNGDQNFTPQLVSFEIDCSHDQQCITSSENEAVNVS